MKTTQMKHILILGLLATISLPAQAGVVKDINKRMTDLLSHPPQVMNIYDIQSQKLDRAGARSQPWSGSYWPDINGGIANHYRNHGKLGAQLNFLTRYNIAKNRFKREHDRVNRKLDKWDFQKLNDMLSPSEKYDLLLGDLDFTFTKAVMEEADFRSKWRVTTVRNEDGQEVEDEESMGDDNTGANASVMPGKDDDVVGLFEDDETLRAKYNKTIRYRYWRKKSGSLAYWSGICDGWSPASIYLPRPVKGVTVVGALGHKIIFYPDDLKALGSYLFARTNTPYFATMNYQMVGHKCDESGDPDQSSEADMKLSRPAGGVKDFRCNDVDAGVYHLALVNRIGKDRMGFVMDIDNNLKINNHPVSSYSTRYFNPITGEEGSLKNSMVQRSEMDDAYSIRRNPNAKYIVGVKADIEFMYYIWPEENRDSYTDTKSKDKVKTVSYVYDLELDANGNILGGEWGDRSEENGKKVKYADQPDFIWMAAPGILPYSEQSMYANAGTMTYEKDANGNNILTSRPFGRMNWAWDGKSAMPEDWVRAARADMSWNPPVTGEKEYLDDGTVVVNPPEARDSVLKSAQPLSHIVYFLFDKARNSNDD